MSAAVKLGREARTAPRRELSGADPGALRLAESGRRIDYTGVDISRGGIGIVTADQILPERLVVFELNGEVVELELCWSSDLSPGSAEKRYGFKVTDPGVNLEKIAGINDLPEA